ncbi:lipopolysaccharide biosynthesis protein [Microbacterium sediminicola]|uniref:lipopolysaccharide biosynthesis protein n=1 Tax=Microbacterium sediminicola TaxID=415210 RepID=UPI0031E3C8D7
MKRRTSELILGQLVGQIALVAAIPFLTRLMPQAEMGIYQAGFSIALIVQPLATLRKELLIPVASTTDGSQHRRRALLLSALFAVVAGALIGPGIWVVFDGIVGQTLIAGGIILFSVALLAIENAYLIRLGQYRRLAIRNLTAGVFAAALQVIAAQLIPTAIAVATALLVARLCATALTIARKPLLSEKYGGGERASQRSASAVVSAMVAAASSQAVVVGSFWTLGPAAAAQIGVGQRIAGAPTSLIGQALSQVALGAASPLIRERRAGLRALLVAQTIKTGAAASVTALALILLAPILAEPILGPGWHEAGVLTAIFAVPLSLQLVALPSTTLLVPLGRERQLLVLQITRLTAIAIALVSGSLLSGDLYLTCILTSVTWSLAYAPLLAASFVAATRHDQSAIGNND